MALTRKFLAALGIESDKVDEIISAHTDTVDALKEERDKYKADAEKAQGLQTELDKAKEQLASSDGDGFKEKFDELKAEYDKYKQDVEVKAVNAKKEAAYKQLLLDAGVSEKRISTVMRVTDLSGIELDGDKIKDADKQTETIKSDWADFIGTVKEVGADHNNPPSGTAGTDLSKMNIAEYIKYRQKDN